MNPVRTIKSCKERILLKLENARDKYPVRYSWLIKGRRPKAQKDYKLAAKELAEKRKIIIDDGWRKPRTMRLKNDRHY